MFDVGKLLATERIYGLLQYLRHFNGVNTYLIVLSNPYNFCFYTLGSINYTCAF